MSAPAPHLIVDGLTKTFTLHLLGGRQVPALRGISFSVAVGSFVGIIGRSGSGKSTLLKCLFRTNLPTGGAAVYRTAAGDAVDLATASDETIIALRGAEIGYVAQFLRPTPRVTAVELVARPLLARGVAPDEARARAAALLGRLGLPADLHDGYPVLFSGGEQQRVNIARALVALPRLLLLDEPTSALDGANQATVIALLREVHARGTTILAIFHDLRIMRQVAQYYLQLHEGRVVDRGEIGALPALPLPAGVTDGFD